MRCSQPAASQCPDASKEEKETERERERELQNAGRHGGWTAEANAAKNVAVGVRLQLIRVKVPENC